MSKTCCRLMVVLQINVPDLCIYGGRIGQFLSPDE
jgi:hypothetical protein